MLSTMVHRVSTRLLVLGLWVGIAVGFAPPTTAQIPLPPLPTDDLVPRVGIMPNTISYGGNAVVTVRVEHHDLSLLPHPLNASIRGVQVEIMLTPLLQQVGNIIAGGGFQCAGITPISGSGWSQFLACASGTIPWGASVDIIFEVIPTAEWCYGQGVLVQVDPNDNIFEIKGNNVVGATLSHVDVCIN